ncbi:MAG: tetratricopeptide repeat protein [Acidobacteria bacterium]|nr:tetratricopeptide repeat protein [Acidobacteriota bacterium]
MTRRGAAAAFLLGATLYAGTIRNGFVFDDIDVVQKNPLAHAPPRLGAILTSHYWANVQATGNLYRPLTILSFALNDAATGRSAAGYHAVNAILHGAVAALVVLVGAALGWSPAGAIAAGLLFAAHAVHVEAVAPVVGRSELLAALFALAAWLCHRGAVRSPTSRARLGSGAAASALFALALLSKENAAVLPALVVAADLALDRSADSRRRSLRSAAAMLGVVALFLAARSAVVPGVPAGDPLGRVFGGVDAMTRVRTAVGVMGRYLGLLVFPNRLSADYSYRQIPLIESMADPLFLVSTVAHVALAISGFALASRARRSGVAVLCYLGTLFPVSNLAFSIGTVMGERLLYLPSVGFCLLVPAIFSETFPRPGRGRALLAAALLVPALALSAWRVVTRNDDWRDQRTLFLSTVRTSPDSAKAHYNLGVAEDDRGDLVAAMAEYRRAIEIKPDQAESFRNYGLDLLQVNRPADAEGALAKAAELDPGIADVFGDLGIARHRVGRTAEAEAAFREEIRRRPEAWRAHYNLGSLFLEQGRTGEAIESLARCVGLNGEDADARAQLGLAFAGAGRHHEAVAAFTEALRISPGTADLLMALARSAAADGQTDVARRALKEARAAGASVPDDLRGLAP